MNKIAIVILMLCALTGCGSGQPPIVVEQIEPEYVPSDPKSAWHDPSDIEMPAWGKSALQSTLRDDEDIIGVNLFEPHVLKVKTRMKDERRGGSGRTYEFIGTGTNWMKRYEGNWIS